METDRFNTDARVIMMAAANRTRVLDYALLRPPCLAANPSHKVSIVARGAALGWTLSIPRQDRQPLSKRDLGDQVSGLMGGRVAEELVFGDITSGAAKDTERAAHLARRMVTEWV